MSELPIDMSGLVPVVDIKLWSKLKNAYMTASLVLDTGAAVTTLSEDILDYLGYSAEPKGKRRITTASGVESVNEITLDKIMFAGFELTGVTVYAHQFPRESFVEGVIGINVLSEFDMFISLKRRILKLTPAGSQQ